MQIQGAVALVTGANRGIGKAFVDALLERGATTVYAGVRDPATVTVGGPRTSRIELKRQNTQVVGVHVGFVDTDLTAGLDVDKVEPAAVAAAALDAVEAGEPEAVLDEVSRQVKAGLSDDHRLIYPQLEHEFAALTAASSAAGTLSQEG
jgi:NAD(P)-dependent dehydrogenase (short-subunit alcohol dehydrogenase family)